LSTASGSLFKISLWSASGHASLSYAPIVSSGNVLKHIGQSIRRFVLGEAESPQVSAIGPITVLSPGPRRETVQSR
jgi:hypothetical protein